MRFPTKAVACAMLLSWATSANGQPAAKDVSAVWAQEARYWSTTLAGDDAGYRALFHDRFTGWPCGRATPGDKSLVAVRPPVGAPGARPEPPVIDQRTATGGGDTVIVYYRATDRAPQPDGSTNVRVRNFTHTWVRTGQGWRIMGGMCRDAPPQQPTG
jgi:hypothetical protein